MLWVTINSFCWGASLVTRTEYSSVLQNGLFTLSPLELWEDFSLIFVVRTWSNFWRKNSQKRVAPVAGSPWNFLCLTLVHTGPQAIHPLQLRFSCPSTILLVKLFFNKLDSLYSPTSSIFLKIIYLWLHCVCCCSGCLLFQRTGSRLSGFSSCQSWPTWSLLQELWPTGLAAPQHVGSSQTRNQIYVPCIGRLILNHWTTREVHVLPV